MTVVLDELQAHLRAILADHPAGVSEHALLQSLADRGLGLFGVDYFHSTLGLFQAHFLLFHCLYRLRNTLRSTRQGDLDIHCLCIRLLPHRDESCDYPAMPEPLAAYYLDLDNLESTGEADVLAMLDSFWKKFAADERRDEALSVLQLSAPASHDDIKRQYRRLAMQHHPDRGGDPAQFQRLEWAMGVLRALYR